MSIFLLQDHTTVFALTTLYRLYLIGPGLLELFIIISPMWFSPTKLLTLDIVISPDSRVSAETNLIYPVEESEVQPNRKRATNEYEVI